MLQIAVGWNGESPEKHQRKSSTVHGWLTKIRGTIMDNEAERQRGRREMMRAAENRRLGRTTHSSTLFSLFRGQSKRSTEPSGGRRSKSLDPASPRRSVNASRHSSSIRPHGSTSRMHSSSRPARHSTHAGHRHSDSHRTGDRSRSADPVRRPRGPSGSGGLVRRTTAPAAPVRHSSKPALPRSHSQRRPTASPRRSSTKK